MMNAYCLADWREEEALKGLHRLDQRDEQIELMAQEVLNDPEIIAIALTEMKESAKTTQHLAQSLHDLFHERLVISPALVQFKAAFYAAAKQRCREMLA
jgi:hypothetical protein